MNASDFGVGQTYNRRRDIHAKYGGQRQGGIATPARFPIVVAFTGESGTQHGYADGWTSAGVYRYFGEGQEGDMKWKGGNTAIRDHAANGEDILLFQTLGRGEVRYMGEFACAGFNIERAPDRNGAVRDAIVFDLVPLDAFPNQSDETPLSSKDLIAHRRLAIAAVKPPSDRAPKKSLRSAFERCAKIRAYVLARAKGICEACSQPAPFATRAGEPYLEPHHIRRLSDGGLDDPRFMGAVCPNCHRRIHHGEDGENVNIRLQERVDRTEADLQDGED